MLLIQLKNKNQNKISLSLKFLLKRLRVVINYIN